MAVIDDSIKVQEVSASIERWLRPGMAQCVGTFSSLQGALLSIENEAMARSSEKRKIEFTAGRTAARRALSVLGYQDVPVAVGEARAPVWPDGIMGSISHANGLAVCVVARQDLGRSIGVDCERLDRVEPNAHHLILSVSERETLRKVDQDGLCPVKLRFVVKEAAYKAWFPISGIRLDFREVTADIDPSSTSFVVHIDAEHPPRELQALKIKGRYGVCGDMVIALAEVMVPQR